LSLILTLFVDLYFNFSLLQFPIVTNPNLPTDFRSFYLLIFFFSKYEDLVRKRTVAFINETNSP